MFFLYFSSVLKYVNRSYFCSMRYIYLSSAVVGYGVYILPGLKQITTNSSVTVGDT